MSPIADTVTLPLTGSGGTTAVVATDDAGAGGHVQIIKLAQSADGSASPITADANGLKVAEAGSGTATLTNVSSSATSVTVLSANSSRLGATIYNDSTQVLYVKFGTTASSSSYTVQVAAGGYYEVPFKYTGRIDGIWASANGNARVTELT